MGINVAAVYDFLVAEMSCRCSHCETAILTPVSRRWEAINKNDHFECSIDGLMDNVLHGGAVPEALSEPESCGEQATMWNGMGNLQGTELLTTRTTPNNTKHPPQPPGPPSPLTQVPPSLKATPSSPTKTENERRNVWEMKVGMK